MFTPKYQLPFSGVSDKLFLFKKTVFGPGGLSGLVVESLGSPLFLSVLAVLPPNQPVVDPVVASSGHFTPDVKQLAPSGEFEEFGRCFVVESYAQFFS